MSTAQATTALPPVDGDRLQDTLRAAAQIGRWRDVGVQRLALTDPDREMRDAFCTWCRGSGLEVTVDRVGNIFARREGAAAVPPVLVGSHLDTQVAGGRYDGALGVLAALEIVRSLNDHRIVTRHPLEIVSWTDEEGARFPPPMLGSGAYTGAIALDDALGAQAADGATFGAELARIGYAGQRSVPGTPPAAYLELHIEQGDVLDRRGLDAGIVTSTFASRGAVIRITGETAHAGATPMRCRQDALAGAAEIVTALDALGGGDGDDARATTTRIDVWPNRTGIVPGEAVVTLDYRHVRHSELSCMTQQLDGIVAAVCGRRGLRAAYDASWEFGSGVTFDVALVEIARRAATQLAVPTLETASAAGHDAYRLAAVAPTLLMFVPCVDGITHNEHEEVDLGRVLRGVNVFAASVLEAANQ